jgi:hypothetical protein
VIFIGKLLYTLGRFPLHKTFFSIFHTKLQSNNDEGIKAIMRGQCGDPGELPQSQVFNVIRSARPVGQCSLGP